MRKKYLLHFDLLYLTMYFGLGVFLPYINLWFEKVLHFNGIQIGIINAISMLVGISIAPFFGYLSDKFQKLKQVLLLILILLLITIYVYMHTYVYIFVLIVACILEIFKASAYPLSDVLASEYANKINVSFGLIRMFGSFGYMMGSIFVGMFIDKLGFNGAVFTTFMVSIGLAICILTIIPQQSSHLKSKVKINFIEIFKNPNFYTIFIYIIFTTTIIDASSSYIGNHIVSTLHGDNQLVSYFTFVMVFPEIIFLPFSLRFINYFGYKKFYIISAVLVFLRLFITGVSSNPLIVIILPITHFTSIMISTVGNITFFRSKFDQQQMASVLTLLTACVGVIRAIYNLFFGYIYSTFGSNLIYVSGACLVIIALITITKTTIFNKP